MTDSSSPTDPKRLEFIPAERFAAFAAAKELRTECVRCGQVTWTVQEYEGYSGFASSAVSIGDGPQLGKYLGILHLSCNNCGTVWTVLRSKVQEWLDGESNGKQ